MKFEEHYISRLSKPYRWTTVYHIYPLFLVYKQNININASLVATSAAFPTPTVVMLFSTFMSFVLVVDYEDKALEKPLKLVLKVGGSEVTELSGSGHDSSYYDDRSDHERERHKEKKKKKKKKSEKDKDKYVDDEERRRRKVSSPKKNLPYNFFSSCVVSVCYLKILFIPFCRRKRGKKGSESRMNQKLQQQQQLLHLQVLVCLLNLSHCLKR